jgi:ribulose-5-phosphate 4-epimerase/fuculose-1-phosphate aldolase
MPSLKGAYHRLCLNCHRNWMDANACVICHAARNSAATAAAATEKLGPNADDIVGRMHKPIPEPTTKLFRARFTPEVGPNVLFRHKEHTTTFGITCSLCHKGKAEPEPFVP